MKLIGGIRSLAPVQVRMTNRVTAV